jgi:hypothetical protein
MLTGSIMLVACVNAGCQKCKLAEQVRVQVIFAPILLSMIEDHRRELPDIPSRAETIRRLCEQALAKPTSTRKPRGRKAPRRNAR